MFLVLFAGLKDQWKLTLCDCVAMMSSNVVSHCLLATESRVRLLAKYADPFSPMLAHLMLHPLATSREEAKGGWTVLEGTSIWLKIGEHVVSIRATKISKRQVCF